MEDINLSIDGKTVICPPGASVLEAAEENGIKIPTLCHHSGLEPFGACRLCLVEDENTGRLMASCVTPAAPDMAVLTASPRVIKHRRNIVRLMMAEHPESCIVCSKGNRCQLRRIAAQLGIGETGLYPMPNYKAYEQANPFMVRDLSKCVLCGKCIRADHELVVAGAIDYSHRGFESRPATVHELPLELSSCTFCGTCLSMCPTGALAPKNNMFVGTPDREIPTVCGFCGVGCSLSMGVFSDTVVEVNPSRGKNTVNGSTLCVRGHFAHDFLNVSQRLTRPLIRRDGQMSPASWDEALDTAATRFLAVQKESGPSSVAFLGSSKCTNEENYLFQKIARVLLKTNSVDNGGYLSGRSALAPLYKRTNGGDRVRSLAGLEKAEAIVVIGADVTETLPVVSYGLKRAAQKGTPLIVIDPRQTGLSAHASMRLPLKPQTDLELINGLSALLVRKKAQNAIFTDHFTKGFEAFKEALLKLDLEKTGRVTGVTPEALDEAAEYLRGKSVAFVVGGGVLEQRYAALTLDALFNLCLMTGSLGHAGAGLYVLAQENNQAGAWDMGTVPDALPGRQPLNDSLAREKFERAWQASISPDRGLDLIRMIEEAEKGNLKALYVMGENPLRALPQPDRVKRALEKLDFIVVQDILKTETTEIADVVLPGAAFSEKGGSFTNLEGRIQFFNPAVPPPGEAKPDWEILDLLARKMGSPRRFGSLERLRGEIAGLVPMYAGINEGSGAVWVVEASDKELFKNEGGARVSFAPVSSIEEEGQSDSYPLTVILGSVRFHLGSGTRTGYSGRVREFHQNGAVELSPQDWTAFGLQAGDSVKLTSAHGSVVRETAKNSALTQGLVFVPEAVHNNDARNLIGLFPLGQPDSPGWKTCPVRLEKL
ncbi:MAG: molybdopterin-dependent oxidoreductase [Deltaproteobacteria bacterium]|nr:molybdopterin-dependent oxidoreductase [Deltaproteobacteria bacterium]MBW2323401.1 molybdopterin-dependent oxidoreductase [Deltaproteobacteria bacterium]